MLTKRKTKALGGITLTATILLTVAGCAPTLKHTTVHGSEKAPAAPSSQVTMGSGHTVTDALGTYETLKLNPKSTALVYNPSTDDGTVTPNGFVLRDVKSAQAYALNYMVTQYLDSSALDTGAAGYETWYKTQALKLYTTEIYDSGDSTHKNYLILNNGAAAAIPQLIRDKKPRGQDITLNVDTISGGVYNGTPYLKLDISYNVVYRASDAAILKLTEANTGKTTAALHYLLKDKVYDGKGENSYRSFGDVTLGLNKHGDSWVISGFQSNSFPDAKDYMKPQDQ